MELLRQGRMDGRRGQEVTTKVWSPELAKELEESDRQFLMEWRRTLLAQVDAIERRLKLQPTTADLRKQAKCDKVFVKSGP